MKRCLPLLLLLIPLAVPAVSGSWVADAEGVTLERGEVRDTSPGLRAANPPAANAKVTSVSWRYQLLSAEPAGLRVQLCTTSRCLPLGAGSGRSDAFNGLPADSEFHFIYYVQARGALNPPLRALSNQVIVNYE
ncbi:flagellar protein FlhE [Serratia fonticola]|jgi:flagellar protein FlhE|uniref:Flagellar protein FlhE n=1 Tax=Serratia fonticola TaxID=47917 RepID=A0A542D1C1_SERFO|nr:flagellar protein FlhE [Serratia fonticola]TQI81104.1 flagellar protein FlhE [Serratia fonticola]TQI96872.1 flagellar protein FlhE [Serratia fonticola]TVZ71367.1 flagellar protein FlhE [Serratia fonticola]